jgi:superfamily II DNA or RNA helicase
MTATCPLLKTVVGNLGVAAQNYNESVNKQGVFSESLGNPPAFELRPYQQTINDLIARATRHYRAVLAQAPTGAGKTVLATDLCARTVAKGFTTWFAAHRIELVNQAAKKFRKAGLSVGFIANGHKPNPQAQVQVVMIQTLARRLDNLADYLKPDYCLIDEAHHATAETYQQAFAPFPEAKIIGFSATPERADGTGLGGVFEAIIQVVTPDSLIEDGWLIKPLYYCAEADLRGLHQRGGEYITTEAAERYRKKQMYDEVVQKYALHGRGYQAICFCLNVEHSKETAEAFTATGYPAQHLDAETDPDERERILADFAAGKFRVLCNVALFTEGFDLPEIGCVIVNRPVGSRSLYHQMAGRGARPTAGLDESTREGRLAAIAASDKPRFIIIDMGGNLKEHGYWEQPITYTLDAPKKQRRKSAALDVAPIKECQKCGLYVPAQARVCEDCATVFPGLLDRVKSAAFVATEFGATGPIAEQPKQAVKKIDLWPAELRRYYHTPAKLNGEQLRQVERAAGYKKGWAAGVEKRRGEYWQGGGVRT